MNKSIFLKIVNIVAMTALTASCGQLTGSGAKSTGGSGSGGFELRSAIFTDGSKACNGSGVKVSFAEFDSSHPDESTINSEQDLLACVSGGLAVAEAPEVTPQPKGNSSSSEGAEVTQKNFMEVCIGQLKLGQNSTYLALQTILGVTGTPATNTTATTNEPAVVAQADDPDKVLLGLVEGDPQLDVEVTIDGQENTSPTQQGSDEQLCQSIFTASSQISSLDFSNTNAKSVSDLLPIKYLSTINSINVSNTSVTTAVVLATTGIDSFIFENTPLKTAVFNWKRP